VSLRSRVILIVAGLIVLVLSFQFTLAVLDAREKASPSEWTLSYVNPEGKAISAVKSAPRGNGFVEDLVNGPVTVELTLPRCLAYDRYRFWVGPYGQDDAARQPRIWNVYVQGESGQWVKAGSEQMQGPYANNQWYSFPLNHDLPCVRRMRLEITQLTGDGRIFRLFEIQAYKSTFLNWIGL